ncbi:hypothetical protein, partial [Edaphobacter sp. HDX4]|uniref:hypothetical protein n=1 Tax=Edaphobacter sp. HDX4 TaxID=2794064 RepID=UPI002FE51518
MSDLPQARPFRAEFFISACAEGTADPAKSLAMELREASLRMPPSGRRFGLGEVLQNPRSQNRDLGHPAVFSLLEVFA